MVGKNPDSACCSQTNITLDLCLYSLAPVVLVCLPATNHNEGAELNDNVGRSMLYMLLYNYNVQFIWNGNKW